MSKLATWQKWFLGVSVPFFITTIGLLGNFVVTYTRHGTVSGVPSDVFNMLWAAVGGGAAFSLPALFTMLKTQLPKFFPSINSNPAFKPVTELVDVSQIGVYAYLISKVTSEAQRTPLVTAARTACDDVRDELFPLTAPPVPASSGFKTI